MDGENRFPSANAGGFTTRLPFRDGGNPATSETNGSSSFSDPSASQPQAAHQQQASRPIDGTPSTSEPEQSKKGSDRLRHAGSKDRANGERRPSGASRTCGKCGGSLTGQFVRALENTFHLECFTCKPQDCGKVVASKFFPVPDQPPNQYPLCETDYFKRLNLICYECGGALRGSYITALDRKYHIDHFTCSVCPTIFGAQDSYYEHEGSIYCHYHYSTKFAQKCNGCQTAILKQFVEIYRNGVNQHWHPECYMIHKYWNVRLYNPGQATIDPSLTETNDLEANEGERKLIRGREEKIEEKVLWIWRTLSAYEEKSAGCISDMLLHVSNGAYVDGVMSAKKFISHVELLFSAADNLDRLMASRMPKGLSYSREAKLLCKKVVAFFQLLAESQETGVRRLGVTQELLSLVTGLAHYLKLLIRICLQGTLKFERETGSEEGLHKFLDEVNTLDTRLELEADGGDRPSDVTTFVDLTADTCPVCQKPVEDRCFRRKNRVFHTACMKCFSCQRDLALEPSSARLNQHGDTALCGNCTKEPIDADDGFVAVSRLQQYIHLLKVAHARLLATLRTSGALPHTSDDPNLADYDSTTGHRVSTNSPLNSSLLKSDSRSRSYGGARTPTDEQPGASYEQSLGDIRRLRSTRMDKQISNTTKRARTSRIIGGPDGEIARPGSAGAAGDGYHKTSAFQIINDRDLAGSPAAHLNFGQDKLQLDDIPRLVAAEQAKDQRPNANRYARGGLVQADPIPKIQVGHRRNTSGGQEFEKLGPDGNRPKRYFSELTALEYFIVRHVAVLSMEPLLEGLFNQEELLDLIEMRKPTFWGKFGKAFSKNEKARAGRKRGVFGVALDQLVERDGTESSDGVGPGALRIPTVVHDTISAMRTMDMSMEGVFRKNGNIRRLKETAETIDNKGSDAVDFNVETPVQVAALLKKFLRELPDPVMTFKLHKLFITSQRIQDEDKRRRVLHLSCCLLPKSHRDCMEVLFTFLNWAASFSVVDEESGSKMDIHNLATVIAPNVLFSNNKTDSMEESFLAIEAVHSILKANEFMCEVPEDLQSILNDSTLFAGAADITTKEILKRYGDISASTAQPNASTAASTKNALSMLPPTIPDTPFTQPKIHTLDERDMHPPPAPGATPTGAQTTWGHSNPTATPPMQLPSGASVNGFYATHGNASGSRDSFGASGMNGGAGRREGSPARFGR